MNKSDYDFAAKMVVSQNCDLLDRISVGASNSGRASDD